LIPVAKLYTAKQAIAIASETLEAFGGGGYIEDTGVPRLLRDAQVLSIWEGTTNVLSLDALRAMERGDALAVWTADVRRRLGDAKDPRLKPCVEKISSALQRIEQYVARAEREGSEFQQAGARGFAYAIARTEAAALLIEYALAHPGSAEGADFQNELSAGLASAQRWCARDLAPLVEADADYRADSIALNAGRSGK
jgi:hypothetical protein